MSYIDSLSPIGIFYLLVCIAYGLFIGIIAKNASLGVNIFIPCLIVTITVFTIFILRFFELPNLFSYRIAIFSFFITLFILNILMITVGRKNTNIEHLSGVSIVSSCEIGGKTGTCYDINGNRQCITPQQLKTTGIVIPDQSKNVVGEIEVEEETKKITCNDIVNYQKTSPLVASDCLTDNNMTGIIYPPLGERCVSHEMVEKCKKRRNAAMKKAATIRSRRKISEMRSQGERVSGRAEVKRKPAIVCSDNRTTCHDPSDIGFFEDECSNISTNGGNWGLRKFEQCNCPSNEKVGVCAQGYHYGEFIDKDSSSCAFEYSDMNRVCNDEMRLKNNKKSINYGYKNILKSGCPPNKQRAICSGNYYSGEQIIRNATDCYDFGTNFTQKCKDLIGNNATVEKNTSFNCFPGTTRALCKIV